MGSFSESSESNPELYAFGERWKLPLGDRLRQ